MQTTNKQSDNVEWKKQSLPEFILKNVSRPCAPALVSSWKEERKHGWPTMEEVLSHPDPRTELLKYRTLGKAALASIEEALLRFGVKIKSPTIYMDYSFLHQRLIKTEASILINKKRLEKFEARRNSILAQINQSSPTTPSSTASSAKTEDVSTPKTSEDATTAPESKP